MANFDDRELALARVYATSLLALAQERNETPRVGEELQQLVDWLAGDADASGFLTSPTVDAEIRRNTIDKMLRGKVSDTLVDALQVINRNGRLFLLAAIHQTYHAMHEELLGRVEVTVRTAAALNATHESRIRAAVKNRTGKEADLLVKIDPSLIGGLVLQIGDDKLDASVSRKLVRISQSLVERASREILKAHAYTD